MFGSISCTNMAKNPTESPTAAKFQNIIRTRKKSLSRIMINIFKQLKNSKWWMRNINNDDEEYKSYFDFLMP